MVELNGYKMKFRTVMLPFALLILILAVMKIFAYNEEFQVTLELLKQHKIKEISSINFKANAINWTRPSVPDKFLGRDQTDPELIQYIKENWIIPPFDTVPGLQKDKDYSQRGQPIVIDKLLNNLTRGFVVECGAYDGKRWSNSLYFELNRKWSGLLIEVMPHLFKNILRLKRRMYMINTCLSPTTKCSQIDIATNGGNFNFGIKEMLSGTLGDKTSTTKMTCFPLYSILAAINVFHIDYFSLDVEGAEIPILGTIPFDKVDISTLTVETKIMRDSRGTQQKILDIKAIMASHGYNKAVFNSLDLILSKE